MSTPTRMQALCDQGWLVAARKLPHGYGVRLAYPDRPEASFDGTGPTLESAMNAAALSASQGFTAVLLHGAAS